VSDEIWPGSVVRDPGSEIRNPVGIQRSDPGSRIPSGRQSLKCAITTRPEERMADEKLTEGRWEQLNKCPDCGEEMKRDAAVGERIGLFYRCSKHGRFRYSWDHDRLERE